MKKKRILLAFIIVLSIVSISFVTSGAKNPTYRALAIGNSNYYDGDNLKGPANDLVKMKNSWSNNYFGEGNKSFSSIDLKSDLTKTGMVKAIKDAFKGAKEGDVSYFYYSGHGFFNSYNNTAYLIGADGVGLGVHELEKELRNIPGKVVVILDSCNSGGFINKGRQRRNSKGLDESNQEYNNAIIDVFSSSRSRSFLRGDKYKVITAASKLEFSYEIGYIDGWGWGGEFTRAYVTGSGYNNKFLADANSDNNITLDEMYNFAKEQVEGSSVEVYPENDKFIIGSKLSKAGSQEDILLEDIEGVNVSDSWEIKFNRELDDDSWLDRVYILDSEKKKVPASVLKAEDGKKLIVSSKEDFDYNSMYTIIIEKNILSKLGFRHNDRVLVRFFTEEGPLWV